MRAKQSQLVAQQASCTRPTHPTLRAILSRSYGSILPTSLIYIVLSLEAVHLWRPARLWVRPGMKVIHSLGFSRCQNAPDPTELSSSPAINPISRQLIFRVMAVKEKRYSSRALATSPSSFTCRSDPCPGSGILPVPFDKAARRIAHFKRSFPIS